MPAKRPVSDKGRQPEFKEAGTGRLCKVSQKFFSLIAENRVVITIPPGPLRKHETDSDSAGNYHKYISLRFKAAHFQDQVME